MKLKLDIVQLAGRDGDTHYNLQRTLEAIATCRSQPAHRAPTS
jgi:(R)-amidase